MTVSILSHYACSVNKKIGALANDKKYIELAQKIIDQLEVNFGTDIFSFLYRPKYPVQDLRLSQFFSYLQKKDPTLKNVCDIILQPTFCSIHIDSYDKSFLLKKVISPLLLKKRGTNKILHVSNILQLKTQVTYHHWENGTRDMPFWIFLKWVDIYCHRLEVFLETLQVSVDLKTLGFSGFHKELFSDLFFSKPWIPTVYLALQTTEYLRNESHEDAFIAKSLDLTTDQVQQAIHVLCDLEMIKFDKSHFKTFKGIFYTPPNLATEKIDEINSYWMSRSYKLTSCDSLHKIQQAALSMESKRKIISWVHELREKIHNEIKTTSNPETVLHMHWQVTDLLSSERTT